MTNHQDKELSSATIALLKEAAELINKIDPNNAPDGYRLPLADELWGTALMLGDSAAAPHSPHPSQ